MVYYYWCLKIPCECPKSILSLGIINSNTLLIFCNREFHFCIRIFSNQRSSSHLRRCESESDLGNIQKAFRAKPVPKFELTAGSLEDLSKKRQNDRKQRAMELLANSSPPKSLQAGFGHNMGT